MEGTPHASEALLVARHEVRDAIETLRRRADTAAAPRLLLDVARRLERADAALQVLSQAAASKAP